MPYLRNSLPWQLMRWARKKAPSPRRRHGRKRPQQPTVCNHSEETQVIEDATDSKVVLNLAALLDVPDNVTRPLFGEDYTENLDELAVFGTKEKPLFSLPMALFGGGEKRQTTTGTKYKKLKHRYKRRKLAMRKLLKEESVYGVMRLRRSCALLDMLECPDFESLIFQYADSNRTCVEGLAALTGACRAAAGQEYVAVPIRRSRSAPARLCGRIAHGYAATSLLGGDAMREVPPSNAHDAQAGARALAMGGRAGAAGCGGEGQGGTRRGGGTAGYRRVFHRTLRVRALMRRQVWQRDFDEFLSDSSYDSVFGPAGASDLYG